MKQTSIPRAELLRAAIAGHRAELESHNRAIEGLYAELHGLETPVRLNLKLVRTPRKRRLSLEARAKIVAGQKGRWAEVKRSQRKAA